MLLDIPLDDSNLLGASWKNDPFSEDKMFFNSMNVSIPKTSKTLMIDPHQSRVNKSFDFLIPHNISYLSNRNKVNENYSLGLTFCFISSMWYASNIVLGKYAITRNEDLTPYDINFMRAIVSLIVNSYVARQADATLLSWSPKAFWLIIIWNMAALVRSYSTVWSYQFISGSKWILIVNTSPVLIVLMGGWLLGERVTKVNYIVGALALFGCYVLTLSDSADDVEDSNPFLGHMFAFAAWLARALQSTIIRVLTSLWNYVAFPFYYSITLWVVSLIAFWFFDGLVNVLDYDFIDTTLLFLSALGTTFGMICLSLGMRYIEASAAAPITNLEVAFAFIADVFIFGYDFGPTDYIGAGVIFSSLFVHIGIKCIMK
jgi:drug/metabolite transporter (DMT)-like permease